MVHGVGSCSGGGGGGGGFSGGGFSSGATFSNTALFAGGAMASRRSRARRNGGVNSVGGNDDCDCDCKPCCSAMAHVIGLGKNQSRHSRIRMIAVWLSLVFGITGLAVSFSTYGSHTVHATPTDMIPITRGISPSFCGGVSFQTGFTADFYLLDSKPVLLSNTTKYQLKRNTTIQSNTYEYWGFYLTAGSSVKSKSCQSGYHSVSFYVISSANWNDWQRDNYCDCWEKKTSNVPNCDYPVPSNDMRVVASKTDEYYFVFANHDWATTKIQVSFDLQRVQYDISKAVKTCEHAYACDLDYSNYDTDQTIVAYIPYQLDKTYDDALIYSECDRRIWVFLMIFLFTPLGIFGLCAALIYRKCKDPNPTEEPRSISGSVPFARMEASNSTANNSSSINHDYRTKYGGITEVTTSPPSYDDVMRDKV